MIQKLKNKYKNISLDIHLKELFNWSIIAFLMKIFWIIFGFWFTMLVSYYYSAEWVWLLNLTSKFVSIFVMIWSLWLWVSILRYIWEYKSKKNSMVLIKLFYINLLKIVVPFSILIIFIVYFFIDIIAIDVLQNEEMIIPFKISLFIIPLLIIYRLNLEIIRWLKDLKISEFLRNLTSPIISIIFIILLTILFQNKFIPIYVFIIAIIFNFLLSTTYIIKRFLSIKIKESLYKIKKKEILQTSLPMMITSFAFLIMWTIDTFMISRYLDLKNVWIYSVALSISTLVTFILASINTIVAPKFSELYWQKDTINLNRMVYYSSKLIFYTTIPILTIIITFSKFFMWLFWEEFIYWYIALSVLAIWQFINSSCWSVWIFLNMTWSQKIFQNIIIIALILNLVLNYLLIPQYWILWAAIATSISMSFWNIISVIYIKIKFNILTIYLPFLNK